MKNAGIYILTNRVNNKQYVGQDTQLGKRAKKHLSGHSKGSRAIHNAIKKHGADAFDVQLIPYPHISLEALNAVEKWKIAQRGKTADAYWFDLRTMQLCFRPGSRSSHPLLDKGREFELSEAEIEMERVLQDVYGPGKKDSMSRSKMLMENGLRGKELEYPAWMIETQKENTDVR